jgi:hypothetical protein
LGLWHPIKNLERQETLVNENLMDTIRELGEPLLELLKNNCNPYCSIIITDSHIQLVETQISIPTKEE